MIDFYYQSAAELRSRHRADLLIFCLLISWKFDQIWFRLWHNMVKTRQTKIRSRSTGWRLVGHPSWQNQRRADVNNGWQYSRTHRGMIKWSALTFKLFVFWFIWKLICWKFNGKSFTRPFKMKQKTIQNRGGRGGGDSMGPWGKNRGGRGIRHGPVG